jgi:hypothetical protein
MHVTLLLPGALLPREVAAALDEPLGRLSLSPLLARAEPAGDTEADGPPHHAWLADQLFHRPLPLATAPYAWSALGGEAPAAGHSLWHADPVHLEFARDHLLLRPLPTPPTANEVQALLASANGLTLDHALSFVPCADRWFLRAPSHWDLRAEPLAAAIDRPLQFVMPEGDAAPLWNRLLTEVQMTWHAHPLNAAREARGEPTINSVWLHGGGRWEALPPSRYSAVLADAAEWRGAASAAGAIAGDVHEAPRDGALLVWSDLLAPRLLHDWDAWTVAAVGLSARLADLARTAALDLVLTGGQVVRRWRVRSADRLRFWRGRTPAEALSA